MSEPPPFPFPQGAGIDPPEEYAGLRGRPVSQVRLANGRDAYLATRYEDVRTVLSDPRFSREEYAGKGMIARSRESLALAVSDAPDHTRRRKAVAYAFTARRAKQLRPELETLVRRLLAQVREEGPPADLIASFTMPFPIEVMCQILGMPTDGYRFKPWVDAMMSLGGGSGSGGGDSDRFTPEQVAAAHQQMAGYFEELVEQKARLLASGEPPDGVLAQLLVPTEPDRSVSRAEAAVLGAGLLMAGYETTANQLAICVYLLLAEPERAEKLRSNPDVIPAAVEEMLRWTSFNATGGMPHVAREDVQLGEHLVRSGDVVVPVGDAANRDPDVFPDPDDLVLDHADNPHLGLGHGRHYCLGAHLSRAELQVAIACLLEEFDELALAVPESELKWRTGMFVRGLWALPVTWRNL